MMQQSQTHIMGATTFYLPQLGATFGPYLFDSGPQCVRGILQTTDGTTLSILPNVGGSGATLGSVGYLLSINDPPLTWEGPAKFYIGSQSSYSQAVCTLYYTGNDKAATAATGSTAFTYTPSQLFAAGEQGVWYDPSAINLNWRRNLLTYSERMNTSPWGTTANGQVIADQAIAPDGTLTADQLTYVALVSATCGSQSQVLTKAAAPQNITGSIYVKAPPGFYLMFYVASSSSTNSGRMVVDTTTWKISSFLNVGTWACLSGNVEAVGNDWYRISLSVLSGSENTLRLTTYISTSNTTITHTPLVGEYVYIWGAQLELGTSLTAYQKMTDGIQEYLIADPNPTMFQDSAGTIPVSTVEQPVGLIKDRSGRGNHASQSTATKRPVLRARYNFLTYTEEFDNAVWVKAASVSVSPNTSIAPDGTLTADTITADADRHILQGITSTIGRAYKNSVFIKAGTATSVGLRDDSGAGRHIVFNPATGQITETSGSLLSYGSQSFGNGWYKYWMTYVADSTNVRSHIRPWGGGIAQTYIAWGADIRESNDGVNLPDYQRVEGGTAGTSSTAGTIVYDTTNFPLYLDFDGVDDFLSTSAIDFTTTDKMTFFAGIRKLQTSGTGIIAELSANYNLNNGAFMFEGPDSSSVTAYGFITKGTTTPAYYVVPGYTSPIANVISASLDN